MSVFIKHEPCPECQKYGRDRSADNLGVWTDHKRCFSCGYYEGNQQGRLKMFEQEQQPSHSTVQNKITLPHDPLTPIRSDALAWLKQYGITDKEIFANAIGWFPQAELLIFPIVSGSLAWVGRYFGKNPEFPKYTSRGLSNDLFHILGQKFHHPEREKTLVLVEDIVSAIRVSRQFCCMPLLCSDINTKRLNYLHTRFSNLVIWLDPDKHEQALKLSWRAGPLFDDVKVVWAEKDPKCYSDAEIKEFVNG